MNTYVVPSSNKHTDTVSKGKSIDELWDTEDSLNDADYLYDLIDAINQNFVAEVNASLAADPALQ